MKLTTLTQIGYKVPEIADVIDALPHNPTEGFRTWKELCGQRAPEQLTTIAVHHTLVKKEGMKKYTPFEAASIHAKNHIRSQVIHKQGEPGMPYHIYIKDGYSLLCNDLLDFVYGVADCNGFTVHVSIEGDYRTDTLSDEDRNALYAVIVSLRRLIPTLNEIKGHGELKPKNCPCIDMDRVRADIQSIELNLALKESPNAQVATAFTIASRILSLYETAKGNGQYAGEARRKLLLLEPEMKRLGLLS